MKTTKDIKERKINMKEIIYNTDNLKESEMTRTVTRAKVILVNSKDEILLANGSNTYFLIGGHVEDNESLEDCLIREVKEETGINLPREERIPVLNIRYLCKDYPTSGENTLYIATYFYTKCDLKPDLSSINLTEDEKKGGFHLEYIPKKDIIKTLEDCLPVCTNEKIVIDTLEAIKEYLKMTA